MYKLHIFNKAKKVLRTFPKHHQRALIAALEEIQEDPFLGKPLKEELTGYYAWKIGVYRIIYIIDKKDKVITVISAGHRATIYN